MNTMCLSWADWICGWLLAGARIMVFGLYLPLQIFGTDKYIYCLYPPSLSPNWSLSWPGLPCLGPSWLGYYSKVTCHPSIHPPPTPKLSLVCCRPIDHMTWHHRLASFLLVQIDHVTIVDYLVKDHLWNTCLTF